MRTPLAVLFTAFLVTAAYAHEHEHHHHEHHHEHKDHHATEEKKADSPSDDVVDEAADKSTGTNAHETANDDEDTPSDNEEANEEPEAPPVHHAVPAVPPAHPVITHHAPTTHLATAPKKAAPAILPQAERNIVPSGPKRLARPQHLAKPATPAAHADTETPEKKPYIDEFGWTHYPWKKYNIYATRVHVNKKCGCKIRWARRVYKRPRCKTLTHRPILAYQQTYGFKRPCRRHARTPCGSHRYVDNHKLAGHKGRALRVARHHPVHHVTKHACGCPSCLGKQIHHAHVGGYGVRHHK